MAQVLNIFSKDTELSDFEIKVLREILAASGAPDGALNEAEISKVFTDFFYTLYSMPVENGIIHIKVSVHKDIFDYEESMVSGRKNGCSRVTGVFIESGEISGGLYYSVSAVYDCVPLTASLGKSRNTLILLLGMVNVLAKHTSDGLPSQESVYNNFFQFHNFTSSISERHRSKFTLSNEDMGLKEINDISQVCYNLFKKNILDKFNGEDFCLGPIRPVDLIVSESTSCPFIGFAPHINRGSKLVDLACLPWYIDFDQKSFARVVYKWDAKTGSQVDNLIPYSWIPAFYLTLVDELMSITMQTHIGTQSRLLNSERYKRLRGHLNLHTEFKEHLPRLDKIFIEKYLT